MFLSVSVYSGVQLNAPVFSSSEDAAGAPDAKYLNVSAESGSVDEIVKLIYSGEFYLKDIIERQDCFVYIKDKDVYKLITGDEAREIVKKS